MWYNPQHNLDDWINASQDYQAWAMKFVAETFRRDSRMSSFAVHLFIDAWPAGWMKAIMDVDRQPKKAFFHLPQCIGAIDDFIAQRSKQIFCRRRNCFRSMDL
jgi:hypothetical protein